MCRRMLAVEQNLRVIGCALWERVWSPRLKINGHVKVGRHFSVSGVAVAVHLLFLVVRLLF